MKLTKIKVKKVVKLINEKNKNGEDLPFLGLNKEKEFIPTIADTTDLDSTEYNVLRDGYFAINGMHVGRDVALPLGLYRKKENGLISPAYKTFVVDEDVVIPEYFFMIFNSDEMSRYCAFLCDGDIREGFEWEVFCDIDIELPPLNIQKKYVDIYKALNNKIQINEQIENKIRKILEVSSEYLLRTNECVSLKSYVEQSIERNNKNKYNLDDVMGISQNKCFIKTPADGSGNDILKYYVVKKNDFAYSPRNGIAVALNSTDNEFIISFNNTCFRLKNRSKELFMPEYIFMFFLRSEWDRKVAFDSWGSTVALYQFNDLKSTMVPVISIEKQDKFVSIYKSMLKRMDISKKIRILANDISPILIRKSIEEAKQFNNN